MVEKRQEETYPLNSECTSDLHGTVIDYFEKLNDPRVDRTKRYNLLDIILIAISAVICGALFCLVRKMQKAMEKLCKKT